MLGEAENSVMGRVSWQWFLEVVEEPLENSKASTVPL